MTPADLIRPFLKVADGLKPHLRTTNTTPACFELLQDTLEFAAGAGYNFQFIGKSSRRDGGGYRPVWFAPVIVECRRPDGQTENVLIDMLSMDAAWHVPTMRQVKVIVNSTANEDANPAIHGPAQLTSYDISPKTSGGESQYRWHNPPIPLRSSRVLQPPAPEFGPDRPQAAPEGPGRDEMRRAGQWLHDWYRSHEGLQRPQGLWTDAGPDWEGIGAWLFDVYFKARLGGMTEAQAREKVKMEIRRAGGPKGEWQTKHPGETP